MIHPMYHIAEPNPPRRGGGPDVILPLLRLACGLRSQLPFRHRPHTCHYLHNSSQPQIHGSALMEPSHVLHLHTMLRSYTRRSELLLLSSDWLLRGVACGSVFHHTPNKVVSHPC